MASRAQKAQNLAGLPARRTQFEKAGCSVELISDACHHHRVTGPTGVVAEFYASTLVWVINKPEIRRGVGVDSLLQRLFDATEPAPVGKVPGPNVTVFADASYDDTTKAAGWGSWMIRSDVPAKTVGGAITDNVVSSFEAEVVAIRRALKAGVKSGYVVRGDRVMIQSDCLNALSQILAVVKNSISSPHPRGINTDKANRVKREIRPHLEAINHMVTAHELTLLVRHVPGHTAGEGRQWVNREVDRIAKSHMRDLRSAWSA